MRTQFSVVTLVSMAVVMVLTAGTVPEGSSKSALADELLAQFDSVLRNMPEEARQKLSLLMRLEPGVWHSATAKALERGWRPKSNALYVVKGTPRMKLPAVFRPASQDSFQSGEGEALIWEWEDGDPNTIDMTTWVRSYVTGEEITADIQTEVSDYVEDVWERWHYVAGYLPGREQEERDRQRGGLVLVRTGQSTCNYSCTCMRLQCLRTNLGRIFRDSLWQTKYRLGTSFTICAVSSRGPDGRATAILYVYCVASSVATVADTMSNMLANQNTCGTCGSVPGTPAPEPAVVPTSILISPIRVCQPQ